MKVSGAYEVETGDYKENIVDDVCSRWHQMLHLEVGGILRKKEWIKHSGTHQRFYGGSATELRILLFFKRFQSAYDRFVGVCTFEEIKQTLLDIYLPLVEDLIVFVQVDNVLNLVILHPGQIELCLDQVDRPAHAEILLKERLSLNVIELGQL